MPHPNCFSAAAAAAKPLQSCLTLCGPIDGSPPGSAAPGIHQARTLEWTGISFWPLLKYPFPWSKQETHLSSEVGMGDSKGAWSLHTTLTAPQAPRAHPGGRMEPRQASLLHGDGGLSYSHQGAGERAPQLSPSVTACSHHVWAPRRSRGVTLTFSLEKSFPRETLSDLPFVRFSGCTGAFPNSCMLDLNSKPSFQVEFSWLAGRVWPGSPSQPLMDMLTDLMSMKARGSHCVPPHLPHVGDNSHLPSCQEEQACRRRVKGAPRAWLWGGPASSPQEPHLGTQSAALHWFKQPPKKDMSCTHSPGGFPQTGAPLWHHSWRKRAGMVPRPLLKKVVFDVIQGHGIGPNEPTKSTWEEWMKDWKK